MKNNNVEIYLTLGCFGRKEDGFILCPSCENLILKVNNGLDNFDEMIVFLNSCHLFDRPYYDFNGIKNILNIINTKFFYDKQKLWSQKELDSIQKFILMHRQCGLVLKLESHIETKEDKKVEEKPIFIQASSKKIMLKNGITKLT